MYLKYFFIFVSLAAFVCAALLLISIKLDERTIDQAIAGQLTSPPNTGAFVEELNHWVYNNQGFAKNRGYFLIKKLGPTPVQVLQAGGDCSDKSRLLAALFKRFGMDSTLVMLYACEGCKATHTIVEVRYKGGRMAADPVFDIVFPTGNDRFYGVKELKQDPSIMVSRLDELVAERGSDDKVAFYKRETESYNWPKTINWEKNGVLLKVAALIEKGGHDPSLVMRPHFMEDPKLFLLYLSLFFGVAAGGVALALSKVL
jgi:hypothetical protein